MLSTKSILATSEPGAKKRISIDLSSQYSGISGRTIGRNNTDTKVCAFSFSFAVKGSSIISSGGFRAASKSLAKQSLGTAFLSSGIGRPPSAIWKTPSVVRRSLLGLWRTPLRTRYEVRVGDACLCSSGGRESSRAIPQ